jgi:hypothetical protein
VTTYYLPHLMREYVYRSTQCEHCTVYSTVYITVIVEHITDTNALPTLLFITYLVGVEYICSVRKDEDCSVRKYEDCSVGTDEDCSIRIDEDCSVRKDEDCSVRKMRIAQ